MGIRRQQPRSAPRQGRRCQMIALFNRNRIDGRHDAPLVKTGRDSWACRLVGRSLSPYAQIDPRGLTCQRRQSSALHPVIPTRKPAIAAKPQRAGLDTTALPTPFLKPALTIIWVPSQRADEPLDSPARRCRPAMKDFHRPRDASRRSPPHGSLCPLVCRCPFCRCSRFC